VQIFVTASWAELAWTVHMPGRPNYLETQRNATHAAAREIRQKPLKAR
jgi:hypothetical protein